MSFLFSSISIETLVIVFILAIIAAVSEIYNMKKNNVKNPTILFFPCLILTLALAIWNNLSVELTTNVLFQKATNIGAIISAVLSLVVLLVTSIFSYKNGYMNIEKVKKLKPLIISCLIIILMCMAFTMYYKFCL